MSDLPPQILPRSGSVRDAVRDLVRTPDWPNRDMLNTWKRQRPDFAQALAASVQFAREMRDRTLARPFDQVVADRIIVRVSRGESRPDLAKHPTMPGRAALRRWRLRRPDFDHALKMAHRWGDHSKMTARRRSTLALIEAIAAHIRHGGSLRSAAQSVPGAPHHVTLYGWMRTRPEFAREIDGAKRERDDRMEDEALGAPSARFAAIRQRYGQVHGGAPRRR